MQNLSDKDFEKIVVRQGYLTEEQLQECKSLQKSHRYAGKTLLEIAFINEILHQEEVEALGKIAGSKPLIFGGYQVKSVLGEGGLGIVYMAKQLTMKRYVALKVLYPKWMKDEEFRKRFLLEARIAGKLSHTNLIQVFDIGYDLGRYYFSMEYVPGRTLDAIIENDGPLPLEKAITLTLQVLDALNYIWSKNLVHRDIKPGNIILNARNIPKLGDFGFVKSQIDEKLGSDEFVLGTPDYMSPEQAMGKESLDYRSDIYSLGATLYHSITAAAPYQGSESMVIRQHIKAAIPSPRSIDPSLPDAICHVIEKMMAKAPEDRYRSYEELKQDLQLVKQGQRPKLQRLDSSKSTIARVEDFDDHPLHRFYDLEKQLSRMRYREYVYQAAIAVLCVLIIILLLSK